MAYIEKIEFERTEMELNLNVWNCAALNSPSLVIDRES